MDFTAMPESDVEDAAEPRTEAANDTVFHVACELGGPVVVENVLGLQPEMAEARIAYGETLMHNACMSGNFLLHCALLDGDKDALEKLLEGDPTLALKTDDRGNTALHIAVLEGRFEIAEYLINNTSVEVDAQNRQGQTALDILQNRGHLGDESDTGDKATLQSLLVKGRVEYGLEEEEEAVREPLDSPGSVHIYLHDEENPEPNDGNTSIDASLDSLRPSLVQL